MKPMILVTAPVQTRSGYGNHSRDICRALIEDDKYDQFKEYSKHNSRKPKIPSTWSIHCNGSGGGSSGWYQNFTYKGPLNEEEKVIKYFINRIDSLRN